MNPLTRQVLVGLVDEASDEQILSAVSQSSTSILIYRHILRQYMIHFTSIPGNKIDHQATIMQWSNILGYVQLQSKRRRATVSTEPMNNNAIFSNHFSKTQSIGSQFSHTDVDIDNDSDININDNNRVSINKHTTPNIRAAPSFASTITEEFTPAFGNELLLSPNRNKMTEKKYKHNFPLTKSYNINTHHTIVQSAPDSDTNDNDIDTFPSKTVRSLSLTCPDTQSASDFPLGLPNTPYQENLFRSHTETIDEDQEQSDFEIGQNDNKYVHTNTSPPITPPMAPETVTAPIYNTDFNDGDDEDSECDSDGRFPRALSIHVTQSDGDLRKISFNKKYFRNEKSRMSNEDGSDACNDNDSDSSGELSESPVGHGDLGGIYQNQSKASILRSSKASTTKHTYANTVMGAMHTQSNAHFGNAKFKQALSFEDTPRSVTFAPNTQYTFPSHIYSHSHSVRSHRTSVGTMDMIDARLFNSENTLCAAKEYDLSEDSGGDLMVEMPDDIGNFRASLFMRVWLNISHFLCQSDKLLSLQFVSKKLRALALASNHWTRIDIKLSGLTVQNDGQINVKLARFLDSVRRHMTHVSIVDGSTISHVCHLSAISEIVKCVPNIQCLEVRMSIEINIFSVFNTSQLLCLRKLMVYGCVNCNDMTAFLKGFTRDFKCDLECLAFDLCDGNAGKRDMFSLCAQLPVSLSEYCMPRCASNEWIVNCLKNGKFVNLRVLKSFDKRVSDECLDCETITMIGDYCPLIECLSIDCKLDAELSDSLKCLLLKCKNIECILWRFDVAYLNEKESDFFEKITKLKIQCLQTLQDISAQSQWSNRCLSSSPCFSHLQFTVLPL